MASIAAALAGQAIKAGVHAYQNKKTQEAVGRGDAPPQALMQAKTENAASSTNGPAIGMGMNRNSAWGGATSATKKIGGSVQE
jgi:hypothetical protein